VLGAFAVVMRGTAAQIPWLFAKGFPIIGAHRLLCMTNEEAGTLG
jgi:hypothetical protein